MKKINKLMMVVVAIIMVMVIFRKPIALGAMAIVDTIGAKFGLCTINIIDFLNMVYYL